MTRPSGRLPRRRHVRQRRRHILRVLTEGERTEPDYLYGWRRRGARGGLDVSDRGLTPEVLVRRAKKYLQSQPRKHEDREFDEIWCVFDTDDHERLQQAIDDARRNGINVAVSNPCFELWLVLHAQEQTAFIRREDVQRLSETLGLSNGKRIPDTAWDQLATAFETAKGRAQALDMRHAGNGSPLRENPSTEVWKLVDRLRNDRETD